ncbi:DNA internalization-related competence protein ComEC/Rec2 [Spirabiliibacterium falconis]|uniref:DNA internalization-related competence protein ComEC/Rec2 n=1 Tax=Spirabiliibacterium falconis TaxID=572023 RepID=UPI001AACC7C0|nr:DNA internalization-related competence protein ComEC/Rec2 [Spirabiliibacterium falconis]MBE2894665.1 DNA internalization-related competence protein ComEC/Rec2 [Spirabiliibacterium falconis]
MLLRIALCYLTALLQVLFIPLVVTAFFPFVLVMATVTGIWGWVKRGRKWLTTALFLICVAFTQWQLADFWDNATAVGEIGKMTATADIIEIKHQSAVYTAVVAKVDLRAWKLGRQNVLLNWQIDTSPQVGQRWQLALHLMPLKGRLNFDGFSRQRWLISQSIIATATVKTGERLAQKKTVRERLFDLVAAQVKGLDNAGLILALAFGERSEITQPQWQAFRESGTAHLMAISGLHIGLIAFFGWAVARAIQWGLPQRWITPHFPLMLALCSAFLYGYLADFSLPTQRALSMLTVWLLARLLRIHLRWWQVLIYAALVVTLCSPFAYLQEGFWLSFGAVAAIGVFNTLLPLNAWHWRSTPLKQQMNRTFYFMISLLHVQLGLLLFLTPLQLLLFGQVAVGALWSNLVLLPLFSFVIMPLLLLNLFTAGITWHWVDYLLSLSMKLIALLPNGLLTLSSQTMWYLSAAIWIITALLLLAAKYWQETSLLFVAPPLKYPQIASCFLVLGVSCIVMALPMRSPTWQLSVMDVGQGLAIIIERQGKAILYDTGQGWEGGSMARLELIPYLTRRGVQPEMLFISHDDNDHSGGVRDVLAQYPTLQFISPSKKDYGKTSQGCVSGKQWHWQGFTLTALLPYTLRERAKNADSCVLLIEREGLRVLLTGDLDVKGERAIAQDIKPIDWLQVAHHGSKTSSSWQFLNATHPKIALIGVGLHNPWRFPHASVLSHLAHMQSAVFDTAQCGQIRLSVYARDWHVACARGQYSPWYYSIVGVMEQNSLK